MLSLETIENDIAELEKRDTCFATCERLAWLYIVRDHLKEYNLATDKKISLSASSEFLQAINGRNPEKVWPIIDELMETVLALHPRLYDRVLSKIKNT